MTMMMETWNSDFDSHTFFYALIWGTSATPNLPFQLQRIYIQFTPITFLHTRFSTLYDDYTLFTNHKDKIYKFYQFIY